MDRKIHRVTFALFVVTATALLLSPAAIAQAPPPGSYLQSCQSAQMTGADKTLLTAQCKDGNGRLQAVGLPDAWTCLYDIANNNAQLSCQKPHGSGNYQTGPYADSCSGIQKIKNPDGAPQLLATCQGFLGIQPSLLLAPDSCDQNTIEAIDVNGAHIKGPKARILNVNGNLRCVERYTLDPKQQGNADIVGKTVWTDSSSTTHTYWTIDQPNITGIFDSYYPRMTYEHGDTVTLWAGGWTQYGGSGHVTWADYTNRSQGDHYAGLAKLPGTSAGVPLSQNDYLTNPGLIQIGPLRDSSGSPGWSFNGLPMKVYIPLALKQANGMQSPNPSLSLGYVDDGYWSNDAGNGYPDNGYYNHEPGEGAPVQISFQVDHPLNAATAVLPYAIPPDPKPFDLIFDQEDQNGAVLNPRWYSQLKDKPFAEKDAKDPKAPKPAKTFLNFGDSTKSNDICGPAFSTPSEFTAGNVVGVAASSVSGVAAGAELGSFVGPIGTAVGGIIGGIFGGWLFGGSIAADTPTAVDTGKLQALCTSQPVDTDQFKASSSWGSEMLAISTGAFHTVGGQLICGAAPIRGHLNWQPVTYTGMLNFSDWSGVFPEDDDVNMSFVPGTAADNGKLTTLTAIGQTLENRSMRGPTSPTPSNPSETWPYGGLLAEFDLGEMSFESGWWQQFYQLARSAGPTSALTATSEQLNGTSGTSNRTPVHDVNKHLLGLAEEPNDGNLAFTLNAVVTGLMGIDGAHGGGISELHPVFSMAIKQAKDDTQITDDKSSEKWQFFIRNHGDEGSCSYQTHTLEPDPIGKSPRDYYIQLPWPSDNPESVSGQIAVPPSQTDGVVGVEYYPGVGTYLHFQSPPYSTQGDAPSFEIDGAVTLTYTYPKSAQHPRAAPRKQMVAHEPTGDHTNADSTKAPAGAESFDAEDFPWQKILAASKDPAVTEHLKKFFTRQAPKEIAKPTSPDIVKHFDGKRVEPKKLLRDAKLENRTHSSINVKNQRRLDDLFRNAGFSRPTFQAMDSQHVFFIGQDGVLRATEGPFKSDDPGKANSTKIIDRDIFAFEATSQDQVFTLNHHGQLLVETPPFDIASDGRCAEGFVWRAAFSGDRVCVPPRTRDQAAADNLAVKSHANSLFAVFGGMKDICAPGYVWREANATDHVCVSPTTRSETQYDNRLGPSRVAPASLKKFVAWPVAKFQVAPGADLTTLDGYGRIWSFNAQLRPSTKPAKVAEKVRAFQSIDATHALVLTTDDRLQSYPVPAGGAAPRVYNNVWDFQQARDGSLFVIDGDDNLWNEQAQKQVETNVRKIQALDANTLFILKEDGTLSLRKTATSQPASSVNAAVASGIRDFQAVDAQTVFVQDEDGKLWLESGNFGREKPTKALVATNVR